MSEELVRVVLEPKGADAEKAAKLQFILDLKIDGDTKECVGPFPAFGRRGDFKAVETLFPFTLMMDGRMDYGAYASDDDRQDVLEIRKKTIDVGLPVNYKMAGDKNEEYVIKSVTALSG